MDSAVGRRSLTPTRARSLGPQSQPRDPMEDNGSSSTRKRPRLDSGSRSYRSMSADQARSTSVDRDRAASPSTPPKETAADPHPQLAANVQAPVSHILSPSKLPINLRDSSTSMSGVALATPTKETFSETQLPGAHPPPSSMRGGDGPALQTESPSPTRSPEIEVAEIEDMDGEIMETRWRPLGGVGLLEARNTQNELLMEFPYIESANNKLVKTVGIIGGVFEKSKLLAAPFHFILLISSKTIYPLMARSLRDWLVGSKAICLQQIL